MPETGELSKQECVTICEKFSHYHRLKATNEFLTAAKMFLMTGTAAAIGVYVGGRFGGAIGATLVGWIGEVALSDSYKPLYLIIMYELTPMERQELGTVAKEFFRTNGYDNRRNINGNNINILESRSQILTHALFVLIKDFFKEKRYLTVISENIS